jgi:hypothetical protein
VQSCIAKLHTLAYCTSLRLGEEKMKVADIKKGENDETGVPVETVYTKILDRYAVYRTAERVVVQYSDDEKLAAEQRLALAPLNPIRGEINGLIDGWRQMTDEREAKARIFDRRVADALIVGLQGDQPHALELLVSLKDDIVKERTSVARTQYVIVAFVSTVGLVLLAALVTAVWFPRPIDFASENALCLAAAVGAIGAMFSIAVGIRGRSILTDLQSRDNSVDAILRIVIGATSAVVLVALLRSNLANFSLGDTPIVPLSMDKAIVVAFIAGFSERLVGDLLSATTVSGTGGTNPLAGVTSTRSSAAASRDANEQNPLGRMAAAPPSTEAADSTAVREGDDLDCCVADVVIAEEAQTADVELPAASGGIAKSGS